MFFNLHINRITVEFKFTTTFRADEKRRYINRITVEFKSAKVDNVRLEVSKY